MVDHVSFPNGTRMSRPAATATPSRSKPRPARKGCSLPRRFQPEADEQEQAEIQQRNLKRQVEAENEIEPEEDEAEKRERKFPALSFREKTPAHNRDTSPSSPPFPAASRARKTTIACNWKRKSRSRRNDDQPAAPDSQLPQEPAAREQQSENLRAPIKGKAALEIEKEKAPELRPKKRRVIRHRHAHEQRRAARARGSNSRSGTAACAAPAREWRASRSPTRRSEFSSASRGASRGSAPARATPPANSPIDEPFNFNATQPAKRSTAAIHHQR